MNLYSFGAFRSAKSEGLSNEKARTFAANVAAELVEDGMLGVPSPTREKETSNVFVLPFLSRSLEGFPED